MSRPLVSIKRNSSSLAALHKQRACQCWPRRTNRGKHNTLGHVHLLMILIIVSSYSLSLFLTSAALCRQIRLSEGQHTHTECFGPRKLQLKVVHAATSGVPHSSLIFASCKARRDRTINRSVSSLSLSLSLSLSCLLYTSDAADE